MNSLRLLGSILLVGIATPFLFGGSRAEQWVLREIALGHEADLSTQVDRVLRPAFLKKLLSGSGSGHKYGIDVKGGIVKQDLNLQDIDVSQPVWLEDFCFLESVDLSRATFRKLLSLSGSHFLKDLRFNRANMEESLVLDEAQFSRDASFNLTSVGHLAKFEGAVFNGLVDFIGASVGADFNCSRAHFNAAQEAMTRGRWETVSFNGMRVGLTAFFDNTEFADGADFRFMRANVFRAEGMRFLNPLSVAHFSKMDVNATFRLSNSTLTNDIDMSGLSANSLVLESLRGAGKKYGSVDLGHAQVHNDLWVKDVNLEALTAPSLHVSGPAVLSNISIAKRVDLQASHFDSLELSDISWPQGKDAFLCDGLVFRHIICKKSGRDQLLQLPKMAKYSASVYAGVAEFLKNQGSADLARKVRMDQRDREAEGMNWYDRTANFVYWAVIGYGEKPRRAFIWIAVVVALGTWLFRHHEEMGPTDVNKPGPPYNPFWYSLGLFLPVVDLDMSKQWRPIKQRWKAHYARAHVLLGWILVPLAVAAITGLLK